MNNRSDERRGAILGGIALILLGLFFLAQQFFPTFFAPWFTWPLIMVAAGILLLAAAVFLGNGGMAVPGVVVAGIGGILFWQNLTGNWESWAYIWTLIPGFVGLGILIASVLEPEGEANWIVGAGLLAASGLALLIFGSAFAWGWDLIRYWPLLLILVGIGLVAAALRGRTHRIG